MCAMYNRQPLLSDIPEPQPSYYFQYSSFKGINEDKNFLAVDQETFADSKNVYINDDGILKSRPSLISVDTIVEKVKDVWFFGQISIYKIGESSSGRLRIIDKEIIVDVLIFADDVMLKEIDGKIFMFADFGNKEYIKFYDKIDRGVKPATDILYIPNLEAQSDLKSEDVETRNLLTSRTIKTFLFNPELGLTPEIMSYPEVSYKITTPISENWVKVNTQMSDFDKRIIDYAYTLGDGTFYASDAGQLVYVDITNQQVRYSPDGRIFTKTYDWNFTDVDTAMFRRGDKDIGYLFAICFKTDNTDTGYRTYTLDVDGSLAASNEYDIFSSTDYKVIPTTFLEVQGDDDEWHYNNIAYCRIYYDGTKTYFMSPRSFHGLGYNADSIDGDFFEGCRAIINCYEHIQGQTTSDANASTEFTVLYDNYYLYTGTSNGDVFDRISRSEKHYVGRYIGHTNNRGFYYDIDNMTFTIVTSHYDGYYPPANDIINSGGVYACNIKARDNTIWAVSDDAIMFTNCEVDGELWECGVYKLDGRPYPIVLPDYDGEIKSIAIQDDTYIISKQKYGDSNVPVYMSGIDRVIELRGEVEGEQQNVASKFQCTTTLNESYFSVDNTLYITEYKEEDTNFKLYIPERSKQVFNSKILAMAPISSDTVAIFTEDEIWYTQQSEAGHIYFKSKLKLSLNGFCDVVTDRNGVGTMICDRNGLITLSYQSFMATSEQALTYLSTPIQSRFEDGLKNKITVYKNYVFCYNGVDSNVYLLDVRNGSWWYFDMNIPINKILVGTNETWDYELAFLSDGMMYKFSFDESKYYDTVEGQQVKIDWFLTSQKLHFNAPNRYKRITNMTFYDSELSEDINGVTVDLSINNYRKYIDEGKPENFEYDVQLIKTYVKRLNYSKINEFEYTLKADKNNAIQTPLSLSNISIKYRVGNEVR